MYFACANRIFDYSFDLERFDLLRFQTFVLALIQMCLVIITLDASKSDDDEVGPPPAKITKRSSDTKGEGQCVLHVL